MLPVLEDAMLQAATDRLLMASRTGVVCEPVRDLIGSDNLAWAYAVQQRVTEDRLESGARVVGRKIGLTSAAVQEQLGVSQPDFGVLFDDMEYAGGDTISFGSVLQPRVEAEIAFVLAADLVDGPLQLADVRSAVAYAMPALEVCGSRVADWDISFADTVADNASAGAFVLGPVRTRMDAFEPKAVTMSMTVNGEIASRGSGTACLGNPLLALQWLARLTRELGEPLRAGEIVLSGALGPMRPVTPGATITATIDGLGSVMAVFTKE